MPFFIYTYSIYQLVALYGVAMEGLTGNGLTILVSSALLFWLYNNEVNIQE